MPNLWDFFRLKRSTNPAADPSLDYGEPLYNQAAGELRIGKDGGGRDVFPNLARVQALIAQPAGVDLSVAVAKDVKPSGVDGGGSVGGVWIARDLNLLEGEGFTLSSNQLTADFAGSRNYLISASAPAYRVFRHQLRLKHNANYYLGSCEYTSSSNAVQTRSDLAIHLVITGGDVLSIEHRCESSVGSFGLGIGSTWGSSTFTHVVLLKL